MDLLRHHLRHLHHLTSTRHFSKDSLTIPITARHDAYQNPQSPKYSNFKEMIKNGLLMNCKRPTLLIPHPKAFFHLMV
eukprot:1081736-Amphidinium_carterae.1